MECTHRFPSFGRFECVSGLFWPKKWLFLALQILKLRSATCESRSRPPPLSFSLKLCVIVLHTHRYHPPKFHPNLKPHDGVLIFPHFARAAACCLLLAAAKPGRSTLDTKKGYKTKTSSTSSVTLTKTEYWDQAGGERNIIFKAFCDFRRAKIPYNGVISLVCAPPTAYLSLCKNGFSTHF